MRANSSDCLLTDVQGGDGRYARLYRLSFIKGFADRENRATATHAEPTLHGPI